MKKYFNLKLLIIIMFLICFTSLAVAKNITVMTYNIKYGRGMDNEVNLDRIAATIEKAGADIVALQEVDKQTSRVSGVDTPQYIAEKLGMYYAYGPNIPVHGGWYGNAVISRYPILSSRNHRLSWGIGYEIRSMLLTKIKVGDQYLNFASTHLTHKDNKLRVKQVEDILNITRDLEGPIIIAGDFNAHAVTVPIMLMARQYNDAHSLSKMVVDYDNLSYSELMNGNLTFPSEDPMSRIDYIFLSEELMLDRGKNSFRVIDSNGSDHLPVVANIVLPAQDKLHTEIGIIKSNKMLDWSKKLKLKYQESLENTSQFLKNKGYKYQVIPQEKLTDLDLNNVKMLLIPDARYLTTVQKYKLSDYVMRGGKILAFNQVGIESSYKYEDDFFSDILGIKYLGWNYLRPLHGFIKKTAEHPIWDEVSSSIMMESHDGMIVTTQGPGKVLGEWYNDFQAMPSHPDYKNGAIIEGKNTIYIAKNLFIDDFNNGEVQTLITNCIEYLLNK
jgi:endonuclease/exonuclease/phosphatase family metal-dependent hydrolase